MLYDAYEFNRTMLAGASAMAGIGSGWAQNPANPWSYTGLGSLMSAGLDVFSHAAASYGKPEFGFTEVEIDGRTVPVVEEIECRLPFGQLKHFIKPGISGQPKLLIVAPMSGHYATLLRGTVARMLPGHDVWITDWRDARQVPLAMGGFDLDDYIDYVVKFLSHVGGRPHVLAVCQPSVPVYAAAALMSADNHPSRPATLTMMGGPVDTREAPTTVNTVATQRPMAWFKSNVIQTVPFYYPGGGRQVYPGFLQLTGFMAMNLGNHLVSYWGMFKHLVEGDEEGAGATKAFYDEYRSVCDMTAEFYLQTIDVVFQRHLLPKGEMMHRDRRVDPGAIKDIAVLAIEGEKDDISGLGQTKAALTLASNLPDELKQYYMAEHVGHYGIFNGRRWRETIAPVLEAWIVKHDRAGTSAEREEATVTA